MKKKPCCAACASHSASHHSPQRGAQRGAAPCSSCAAPRASAAPEERCTKSGVCLNLRALRAVLGRTALVEAMEVRASGRPSVNVGQIWRYFTTAVYASGDLPVVATREALQNAVDAIKKAIRHKQIGAKDGRFEVTWDPARRTLSWEDNGIGMDVDTILGKFLSLGDSGKTQAASSDEAAGGFGVAKAVILGASTTFEWEMLSRDNRAVCAGSNAEVMVYAAPARQGTRITVQAVDGQSVYDYDRQAYLPVEQRIRDMLSYNDLPDIALIFNGQRVQPAFSRRGGTRVSSGEWGGGTTAQVKAYRRASAGGGYYVRLGGLFQYRASARRAELRADVTIDLQTTVRPGEAGYPLNAARDALQAEASRAYRDLSHEVETESESTGRAEEYEVFLPDSEGGGEMADLLQAAVADKEVQQALHDAAGGLADYFRAQSSRNRVAEEVHSTAPEATRRDAQDAAQEDLLSFVLEATAAQDPDAPPEATAPQDASQIERYLTAAQAAQAGQEDSAPRLLTAGVREALQEAAAGLLSPRAAETLEGAIDRATDAALAPGGGGLLQAFGSQTALAALQRLGPAEQPVRRRINPFGKLAGLRVSKKNYDRARARRFMKNYGRWLPYLALWDQALRLIAREGGVRRRFKSGFVLDDSVGGLAAEEAYGTGEAILVIYIHPDTFKANVEAHRTRPNAIAAYLHAIACHELAHGDGRMGEGHGETFVSAREALANKSTHLLEPIAALAVQLLGLKTAETPAEKALRRVQQQLELCRAKLRPPRQTPRPRPTAIPSTSSPVSSSPLPWSRLRQRLMAHRAGTAGRAVLLYLEGHHPGLLRITIRDAKGHPLELLTDEVRGLNPVHALFVDVLRRVPEAPDLPRLVEAAGELVTHLQQELRLVNFWHRDSEIESLRKWILAFLDGRNARALELVPFGQQRPIADELVELARNQHDRLVDGPV